MKSNRKIKTIILIFLGIILAFSPIFMNNPRFNTRDRDISANYDDEFGHINLKTSAISGKIHIDGNSGWLAFKNAGNCTGQGTASDPYNIEDLIIDGGNEDNCIWIENSDVHFRIENCTVFNAIGTIINYAGIRLDFVSNGKLIDNIVNDNYYGIRLEESDNNEISGNFANENIHWGMYLDSCDNNIILENYMCYAGDTGIVLSGGEYNFISRNTANYNSNDGIRIWGSYNDVVENWVKQNGGVGIQLSGGSYQNNIYLNCLNNTLNANDPAYQLENRWDNGAKGNYWHDYTGIDSDGNGIGDVPYNISGIANSQDNFPLMSCQIGIGGEEEAIPGYNSIVLLVFLPLAVIIIKKKLKKSII
ncbi:MAG: nitrous oxide reductase family maturation protein NosD [Candidatus Hodarchaeota archaeon]